VPKLTSRIHRIALLAIVTTTLMVPPTPAASAATPGGNALKRWAATMGGPQELTRDQALHAERSFDVIVGLPRTYDVYAADMRAANPDLKLIAYMNGAYAQSGQGTDFPDAWYARDQAGAKVVSAEWGNFFMNVGHPGWVDRVSQECAARTATAGWSGCYLDMLGMGTLTAGYVSAPPVNPATGMVWTKPELATANSRLAAQVQGANPNRYVVANGLGSGNQYFGPTWGPTSKLLDGVPGGNAQGFIRGANAPIDAFPSVKGWKMDVDMLVDAAARGRSVFTMTRIWGIPATQEQKDAVHRFTLASFLLGTDGNQYLFWSDDGDQGADPQRHRYEDIFVGAPLAPYSALTSGAYLRRFEAATVVVNPTTQPVTVDLGSDMTSLAGVRRRIVSLPARTGDVFTPGGPAVG